MTNEDLNEAEAGHIKVADSHDCGHLLQVAGCASRDLGVTKDDLLSSTAPKGRHNARKDLLLGQQAGILAWDEPRQALGLAAWDEGDLLHCIMPCRLPIQMASNQSPKDVDKSHARLMPQSLQAIVA